MLLLFCFDISCIMPVSALYRFKGYGLYKEET